MKIVALLFGLAGIAMCQSGQITGIVADTSSAAIIGAKVSVVNVATGVSRETVSNDRGNYTVPLLQPGTYRITVQANGFRLVTRESIRLEVDQIARLDFALEIGSVSESIVVTASGPLLQTSSASLGQIIESKQFSDMPLNYRGALGLLPLADGVLASRSFDPNSYSSANIFSANGSRPGQNEILLDGAPNTLPGVFPGRGILGTIMPVDAVQEVKVQTSAFSAEFGRTGGGLINMASRSGTNQWHGSAFDYLRNSALDSNNFFANRDGIPLGAFRRNQFGGTLGAPVVIPRVYDGHNRTFFFFNFQATRASQGANRIVTVPTLAARQGDFSGLVNLQRSPVIIFDPSTTTTTNGQPTRQPFPGNRLPADRINPVGKAIASYYQIPNLPGSVNNSAQSASAHPNDDLLGFRIDQVLKSNQQLFLRYNRTQVDQGMARWFNNAAQGTTSVNDVVKAGTADYTWTASPTVVVEIRYALTNFYANYVDPALGLDLTSLGFPAALNNVPDRVFPLMTISGYESMGNSSGLNVFTYRTHSLQGSVTKTKGAHTLKSGGDFRLNLVDQLRGIDPSGAYSVTKSFTQGPNANTGSATAGDALASLLLGIPSGGDIGADSHDVSRNKYFGAYFQDDWKVSTRLTLNLGLRYELEMPRTEQQNQLDWFDFSASSPLNGQVAGVGQLRGGLRFAGVDGNPTRHFNTTWHNLAPRFGLAYLLTPKTVLRAGGGIFYGSGSIGAGGFNVGSQAFVPSTPYVGSLDGLRPQNTLSNPYPQGFAPASGSSAGLLSQVGLAIARVFDRNALLPYNAQWTFSIQREVRSFVFQASYAGNRGIHLGDGAGININQLTPSALQLGVALQQLVANPFFGIITSPGALNGPTVSRGQLLRPYPQFDALTLFNPTSAQSSYHGASLKVERRFFAGLGLLASWTTSKDISNAPATVGPAYGHQNNYDLRGDRSLVENDISQRFVASANYELPIGKGKRLGRSWSPLLELICGGWQANVIAAKQTGLPLAIGQSPNTSNSLGGGQRPNATGANAALTGPVQSRLNAYLNPAAFTATAPFTFGNVSRTINVRSPGLSNTDVSLFKTFPIREKLKLQFRAEVFNLTNSPMFGAPNLAFGTSAFGSITSQANAPRQLQAALRLFF